MPPPLRIALAQHSHTGDAAALIRAAAAGGAEIVVFPEMWSNGYAAFNPREPGARAAWMAGAVDADGPAIAAFREAARANRIHVVATLLEQGRPAPFNTALLIGPDGETLLRHRKIHTCFFDAPEEACATGSRYAVAEIATRAGPLTLGIMICMDREYPEVARTLSQAGAEILLVPNACYLVDDPDVGDVRVAQLRGRAFEDVVGIAVANYPAPRFDGHSFAVGPVGEVLTMAGSGPELLFVDFDLTRIRQTRQTEWFRWQDRHPDQRTAAE